MAYAERMADLVSNDIIAAKGTAFLDLLLVVGIVFSVVLSDRIGRMGLQIFGFLGCAVGLLIAVVSQLCPDGSQMELVLIFAGFMTFNFMTNLGPKAQTYLIAGEVFPTRVRGLGAGFAASFAKIGAVTTTFLFPFLLADIGTQILLCVLVGTSILGAVITWRFQIETKGRSLEAVEF
ncbi:MFS transporter [Chachezhania sediminis]|uniref:MFS transporter n=1 Tax=Chachezhania sediminis TaxID=2599291 RepID=UPI001E34F67C|nr:MFS transporter [Chachezhania sediminis]